MLKKVIPILLVIIWLVVIFSFSGQGGEVSQSKSLKIVNYIYGNFKYLVKDINKDSLHYYIRKTAHVTIYFILCLVVMNALYHGGFRGKSLFIRALIICVFYAVLDELQQRFIGGRSGRVKDVFIDSIGISLALIVGVILQKVNKLANR